MPGMVVSLVSVKKAELRIVEYGAHLHHYLQMLLILYCYNARLRTSTIRLVVLRVRSG